MHPDSTTERATRTGIAWHLWSEHVSFDELRNSELLVQLRERAIELDFAVTPRNLAEAPKVVRACREHGVRVAVWPLLSDAEGRWANARNAPAFVAHVRDLVALLGRARALPDGVILDLEPPIALVRAALRGRVHPLWFLGASHERYVALLDALVHELRERDLRTTAATPPFVLFDPPAGVEAWQRMMAAPIHGIPFDCINVMAYTSLFEGYSRGLVRRRAARHALRWFCARAVRRFGDRASVSLGVIGGGALGDEKPYRSVTQLREDIEIAKATGMRDIAVYSVDGILARGSREEWMDAIAVAKDGSRLPSSRATDLIDTERGDRSANDSHGNRAIRTDQRKASRQPSDEAHQTDHEIEDARGHATSE